MLPSAHRLKEPSKTKGGHNLADFFRAHLLDAMSCTMR